MQVLKKNLLATVIVIVGLAFVGGGGVLIWNEWQSADTLITEAQAHQDEAKLRSHKSKRQEFIEKRLDEE